MAWIPSHGDWIPNVSTERQTSGQKLHSLYALASNLTPPQSLHQKLVTKPPAHPQRWRGVDAAF